MPLHLAKSFERALRRARRVTVSWFAGGPSCGTCGFQGKARSRGVLSPELAALWELTPEWIQWMEQREGSRCAWCDSNLRSAHLARAVVGAINGRAGTTATHLSRVFRDPRARALAIAEINSAENLHRYLKRCPGLRYSEFGSRLPGVPSEDLMQLSYADQSFDLVITSDTLEHVPDIQRALREIYRVLKPGAAHVCSVPAVAGRPTRRRATLENGTVTHLLPPTFHAGPASCSPDFLVFYEFGDDFPAICAEVGFEVTVVREADNPALVTFIGRRPL